jgi:hypothetical protein
MVDEARRARRCWPVRVYRLGEEPGDDLGGSPTPEERLAMMWALEGWSLVDPRPDIADIAARGEMR